MTQLQIFYGSYTRFDPAEILSVNNMFLIQELIKKGFTDKEIYLKFELQEKPYVIAYCMRLRRK